MTEWGAPQNFAWLWVLPVMVLVFRLASARKRSQMKRFGDPGLVGKLVLSFDGRKRLAKRALVLLAAAAMVLALCQPHFRTKEIEVERKGVNVIIAVDVSRSMLARDVAPNRLEKAKLELSTLIDRLKQDRIGIVAFAGEAFIQCPLTLDKNAVKIFLGTISPDIIPTPGTAVGAAIRVAIQAFDDKEKDDKAVILLTDGEDHESDPLGAAKKAKAAGIRVYTIGLGTQDGSTVPGEGAAEGFKKDRQGKVVLSKLDENLLKRIAQETGGSYHRSTRGELEVDRLVGEIRNMSQKGFSKDKIIEYDENYQYFLVIALILLCLEMMLSERRRAPSEAPAPGKRSRNASAAALLVLWAWPFLCGFEFYSALKNEEGNRHMKKGLVGKAKQAYVSAQKSEPKAPEVAFNLGNAYYKEDAFDRSLESYAAAARLPSTAGLNSKAFYNLGNSLFRQKQTDKAVEAYKEALRKDPKDEDAKYNLQLLLKKQDQQQQQKKDDQKKDQQKDQKDKKDEQDQGGGGGGQGQENQDKQKGSDGQSGQEKGQEDQQGSQGQEQNEQDKKDRGEQADKDSGSEQQDSGQPKEPGDEKNEGGSPGESGEEEERPAEPKEGQGEQGGQGKEDREEPKEAEPKSAEEIRAEQILNALNDQEKKTFRLEANEKGPISRAKRYVEKDW